jgi:hypothetical protein
MTRDIDSTLTKQPDLSRVGETLRSLSRALRGPGADDEAPTFAAALAAASEEAPTLSAAAGGTGQEAAPDLTRGGRQTGDLRTPDSQAMTKRSRDHAAGAQLRASLTSAAIPTFSQPARTPPPLSQRERELAAQTEAMAQAAAAARGTDASSTTASARATDPVSVQAAARTTAQEAPQAATRAPDPVTVQATGRTSAQETLQAATRATDPVTVTPGPQGATRTNDPSSTPANGRVTVVEGSSGAAATGADFSPLTLKQYPKPSKDRSGVLNWTSTTPPTNTETARLIDEAKRRQVGWVTFSVDPDRVDDYDNLAKKLSAAGLQPIARIQDTEGDLPTSAVADVVQHLKGLGVRYYELFDGANLANQSPDDRVDVNGYAERWLRSAQTVVANGGLPGIGALSPKGDYDDLGFMRQLMSTLKANGGQGVLSRSWMAMQNTAPGATATSEDVDDTLDRARWYDRLTRNTLGQSIPILATIDPSGRGEPLTGTPSNADQQSNADQAERALRDQRRQTPAIFAASRGSLVSDRV